MDSYTPHPNWQAIFTCALHLPPINSSIPNTPNERNTYQLECAIFKVLPMIGDIGEHCISIGERIGDIGEH